MTKPSPTKDPRDTLLALMESAAGEPVLIGRTNLAIEAGQLLTITADTTGRPVLRLADDAEIRIPDCPAVVWGRHHEQDADE